MMKTSLQEFAIRNEKAVLKTKKQGATKGGGSTYFCELYIAYQEANGLPIDPAKLEKYASWDAGVDALAAYWGR